MKIDKPLILKLEKLARLKLSEADREHLLPELNKMLQMVEKLNEVNTEETNPLRQLLSDPVGPRMDEIKNQVTREEGLKNAPLADGQFFKVPKVIDKDV